MTATLLGGAAALLAIVLVAIAIFQRRRRRSLRLWHRVRLREEFRARRVDEVTDWQGYRQLEERLFAELDKKVTSHLPSTGRASLNRYRQGSRSHPSRQPQDWNRSFELAPATTTRGAALLLHGLSDSPYSLRAIATLFAERGIHAVVPRVPGHGTVPAALSRIHRRDWSEAVRLAAERAARLAGSGPLYLGGYSTGATLAIDYLLSAHERRQAPPVERLFLFSPALGLGFAARLANLHELYSFLPGLEAGRWASLQPEYDPFKYNSFPKRGGDQVHLLIKDLYRRLRRLTPKGAPPPLPPITAFQSVVDATVVARALVERLYAALPANGSELVMFDVNRWSLVHELLSGNPRRLLDELEAATGLAYEVTVVTNRGADSREVVARRHPAGGGQVVEEELHLAWPPEVYSLSHVALVFPPDDPLYGGPESDPGDAGLSLGTLAPRGERDLLKVPSGQLLRLRHNPFFRYVEERIGDTLE